MAKNEHFSVTNILKGHINDPQWPGRLKQNGLSGLNCSVLGLTSPLMPLAPLNYKFFPFGANV
tara:strand:- start:266 stop:454 length:189 start_codon:yes stop_codon:yes gene_type:complete